MSGATVLVTGGAGYVGSHSVVELLSQGFKVVVVDNLVNASSECLKRVEEITGKEVICVVVDLCDKDGLGKVFSNHKIDCVIHFAALKAVGESVSMPLTYYRNNVVGTLTLLEVMKAHNVKKIVYSSSATVYGTPQTLPLTEDHPTGSGCTSPYGKSKYFVEQILQDIVKSDETWSVISLRYFNPVGAHESGKIGEDPTGIPNNIMPYIAQVAIGRRKDLKVFGNDYNTPDGTGVRDYVHIQDLAMGHIAATNMILSPNFCGWRVYNLGRGSGLSVLQLVKAFEEVSGQKVPCEIVGRRAGDIDASYADVSLAKKELQWQATRGVLDMCRDTWKWQSLNPNGYQISK